MKKIALLIALCFLSLCSCTNLSMINKVKSVLNDGLFRNYTVAKVGGYSSDDGIISASYKFVWASSSYNYSMSKISQKNPSLSQYWVEKYALLTPSLSDSYGAFVTKSGFAKNGRGFYVHTTESDGTKHSWYWYSSTCLLMEYTSEYPDGSNVRYGVDWELN